MSVDFCIPADFKFISPGKYEEGVVKAVRFAETSNIKEYDSDPNDNISVKEILPHLGNEEVKQPPLIGFYLWDGAMSNDSYRVNTVFNTLSPRVNDHTEFKSNALMSSKTIKTQRLEKYMEIYTDPVRFITSQILLPPFGSTAEKEMDKYPKELVVSSIIYIMDILEKLDNGVPFVCISYKDGFSISNRPGKDQRPPVRKILQKMIDHFDILNPTSCTCILTPIVESPPMAVLLFPPPIQDMDLILNSEDPIKEDDSEI